MRLHDDGERQQSRIPDLGSHITEGVSLDELLDYQELADRQVLPYSQTSDSDKRLLDNDVRTVEIALGVTAAGLFAAIGYKAFKNLKRR